MVPAVTGGETQVDRESDDMKSRKTSLDALESDPNRVELHDPMGRNPHKPEPRLGKEAQARIGDLLRTMYNSYVDQGVPDHLTDLVRRLGDHD